MNKYALVLLVVGSSQMVGDLCGWRAVKAIGAATLMAPAPRVFSAVRGFETYTTRFFVDWTDAAGGRHSLELVPEVAARLRGPYLRRNVWGAALAYGPVLAAEPASRALLASVLAFGLGGDARLLAELGATAGSVRDVVVRYEPRPGVSMPDLPLRLPVPLVP
ncbi:MAG: hypothetical protein WAT39_22430 [Planctomycetota bacterium]